MSKTQDEIVRVSIRLMLNEPFYGHFFTNIIREVSDRTPSISVFFVSNQTLKLLVNEAYWQNELKSQHNDPKIQEQQTVALRYGAIKHQILHVIFKHIIRRPSFNQERLFDIAADLVVNQYIDAQQLTLDAITISEFPDFELPKEKGLDFYYKRLVEEWQSIQEMDEEEEEQLNKSQQQLKELVKNQAHLQLQQHQDWEEIKDSSNAERKILENQINQVIQSTLERMHGREHGTLPAGIKEYLDLLLQSLKPNINWRRILRLFTASSSRTRLKNTMRRPSKRYGTTPGIKIKHKQRLAVVVDTSGSVNQDELREFFGEIYYIWKQGVEIHILECDTIVHQHYLYDGSPPNEISGRGGTDFNAPIRLANEEIHPDAIIYFTDGLAPTPKVTSRQPILWLLTAEGLKQEDWDKLPGRKVRMLANL